MKMNKTAVWKGIMAVLSLCLILSIGSVATFADNEGQENTQGETTVGASQIYDNADTLSTESTENVASVPEKNMDGAEKEVTDNKSGTDSDALVSAPDSATSENTVSDDKKDIETVNMYRFYNPNSGEHFYTASKNEGLLLRNMGWSYEGIGWVAPKKSTTPVYRLYNPNAGEHHYTTSVAERDFLVNQGWNNEGIGWYSDDNHTIAMRREYNPNAKTGTHNYTSSTQEANYLVSLGWNDEGIAWYACAAGREGNAVKDIGAITYYEGKDYSSIYNYSYYVSHNPDLASISNDDSKVLEHFMTNGILENRQAKEDVPTTSSAYQSVRKEVKAKKDAAEAAAKAAAEKAAAEKAAAAKAAAERKDLDIANNYDSNTNYLILVNRNAHRVYIYQGNGKKGNWKRIRNWACSDGKALTPTKEGVFMIYGHTYMMEGGTHEFYASFFDGPRYFHSILYSASATSPSPQYVVDARLGVGISHGCVRLATDNAKWIYDNIPKYTTVVVTHW